VYERGSATINEHAWLAAGIAMMKHFPPFSFDAQQRTLWRGATPVSITPKAAALLACLLARRGSWVAKDAILSEVWPDAHVQPENIKVLVRELRRALGDSPATPRFIAAVHGVGYEFVAPVTDAPAPAAAAPPRVGSGRMPVVRRKAEAARLERAWDTARASGGVLLVEGDRGTGKTALCQAFLQHLRRDGVARGCHGECFDRELAHEPYYPLLDALQRLDRSHAGFVPALLERHAPSWLACFPQWSDGRTASSPVAVMLDELRAWLRAAAHPAPIAMVIDDLQWADAGTLHLLTALADGPLPPALLLVATGCQVEWTADRASTLAFRSAWSRTPPVVLGPLTVDQIGACLDVRYGPRCAPSLAATIHDATAGNAAIVAALLDGLDARGFTSSGAWRRGVREPVASWIDAVLRAAAVRDLDQLDAGEARVLEAGAAAGLEFTAVQAADVLEEPADDARRVLRALARRGHVIAVSSGTLQGLAGGPRYRFRLPLYAALVAERAPQLRQRQLAQRAAKLARRTHAR
jgi:DNA-binding winged helix-turn-helix (wHTH) protein